MYFPKFVIENNGVPILSKKELEIMAENFLKDFKTETLIKPQAIDIDDFAFNYLGLKLDFIIYPTMNQSLEQWFLMIQ